MPESPSLHSQSVALSYSPHRAGAMAVVVAAAASADAYGVETASIVTSFRSSVRQRKEGGRLLIGRPLQSGFAVRLSLLSLSFPPSGDDLGRCRS